MVPDRVLRPRFLADVDDRVADQDPRLAHGAEIVEIVGDVMEFLRADNQVDVGKALEKPGAPVLRHAAEDSQHEFRVLPLARLELGGLADGPDANTSRTPKT